MDERSTRAVEELISTVRELTGVMRWRDARGLAWKLGLTLKRSEREGALLADRVIDYDRSASSARAQRLIATEVARWALAQWRICAPDSVVQHVAEQLVVLSGQPLEGLEPLRLATSA
jgi:hypothetical protein